MKEKSNYNLKSISLAIFLFTALLFVVFAIYIINFKDDNVYITRGIASYKGVENYSEQKIEDPSAPIGIRKEYSWQIEDIDNNESCLIFYIVHSYAEVRIDDELIYSLTAVENIHLGNSPGSNWVVVPIYQSDVGRKVSVTITPVYTSVQNRNIDFKIGSRYAVFMQGLRVDFPQIILSLLCVIMGILLITVQLCFIVRKRTSLFDMLYLGISSLLLGVWRITDTRFLSIIFANHTAALGYITLSALFIMPIPLLLFIYERHTGNYRYLMPSLALANCTVALAALVSQVAGNVDLRESLTACHIMIIVDIVLVLANVRKESEKTNIIVFIGLLILGSIFDLGYFYIKATSSGNMFTTISFLIYTLYLFSTNFLDINKKANTDIDTKLYNKTRWNEYVKKEISEGEPIGVMMLDLNGLKNINDSYGHKTGDMVILQFSEILRNIFNPLEFLCRWGGDEFAVIVRNAHREKLERYDRAIHKAVDDYNSSGANPPNLFRLRICALYREPLCFYKRTFGKGRFAYVQR